MADKCPSCHCDILPGQEILQIARGQYLRPAITPTYTFPLPILAEYHLDCYQGQTLEPQEQPYRCQFCRVPIRDGEQVLYATRGTMPDPGYIRPESRGYKLMLVAHEVCWEIEQI